MARAVIGLSWIGVTLCLGAVKTWAVENHENEVFFNDASDGGSVEETKNELPEGDVHSADDNGRTALHSVAMTGNAVLMRTLLESNVGIMGDDYGVTPLHLAAMTGNAVLVGLLLDNGADANAVNGDGETPLHWAAQYGNEAVGLLLENGANVNAVNGNGETPLRWAQQYGNEEAVRLLLDNGANVNAEGNADNIGAADNNGQTPLLQVAEENGIEEPIRELSENLDPRSLTRAQLLAVLTLVGAFTYSTGCHLL